MLDCFEFERYVLCVVMFIAVYVYFRFEVWIYVVFEVFRFEVWIYVVLDYEAEVA